MKIIVIAIIVTIAATCYIAYLYLASKAEVTSSPREEMFICDKHGAFRKNQLFKFLDDEWCPLCVNEKIKMPLDSSVDWRKFKNS